MLALAATLIGLMPFFLWTIFRAAIGSLSGMVGGVQGALAGRAWLTAVLQTVLLCWLILPPGVLFSREGFGEKSQTRSAAQ